MKKLLYFIPFISVMATTGCKKETCTDGIKNQNETDIDCGGNCTACPSCNDGIKNQNETDVDCGGACQACPTCSDGIKNQGEAGIDCGGPCTACPPSFTFTEHMTAIIDGVAFTANLLGGNTNDSLLLFQSDQSQVRQLFFEVPKNVNAGTYDLVTTPLFNAKYGKLFSGIFTTFAGTMVISLHNTSERKLAGTFNFTAWEDDGFGYPVDTVAVTNGDFGVEYF
ncbi:MAG: hypothetical protein HYY40_06990 [Bacteroidetes bacterium]|nr:hypothetical protein [Bacteroidota bacterium]